MAGSKAAAPISQIRKAAKPVTADNHESWLQGWVLTVFRISWFSVAKNKKIYLSSIGAFTLPSEWIPAKGMPE
jgi:hypothetical protein